MTAIYVLFLVTVGVALTAGILVAQLYAMDHFKSGTFRPDIAGDDDPMFREI